MKMKTNKLICGIDISKATLDICYNLKGKFKKGKFKNNQEGYRDLQKAVGISYTYVMESTGSYGLKLCYSLKKSGIDVRVESPLVIKRYIQMNMVRNKSDLNDAQWICLYGLEREAKVWRMPTKLNAYCSQMLSNIELSIKQQTMLINYLKSMENQYFLCSDVKRNCKRNLESIKNDIKKMEQKLDKYLTTKYGTLRENLLTIPGLGHRCVAYLITLTDGFKKFENYRQVVAFAGLAPREYSSGTMELKRKICKMGNVNIRRTLFMCSLSAIKYNKGCKQLYERLTEKNKKGKLALIAVCNKLIKQAFAIAKSGQSYNSTHKSVLRTN